MLRNKKVILKISTTRRLTKLKLKAIQNNYIINTNKYIITKHKQDSFIQAVKNTFSNVLRYGIRRRAVIPRPREKEKMSVEVSAEFEMLTDALPSRG